MSAARPPLADPAAEAARLLCRLALITLMILTPAAELHFHGVLYVLLPVGAGILVASGALSRSVPSWRQLGAMLLSPIGLAALFLAFWAGLSLIWAPFPADAAARFGKAFGTGAVVALAIAFLPERTKASNLYLLPFGVALTAIATALLVLFGPQSFWKGPDPDYLLAQRCIMSVTILVWPAIGALALRDHRVIASALAVVVTAAALVTFLQVALVAIALAALVYVIAMTKAVRASKFAAFGFAALVLLAPLFAVLAAPMAILAHVPHSGPAIVFGDVIVAHWPKLITGHGLGVAARALELGALPSDAPRSILFTVWYELGLLGAVGFAVLGVLVFLVAGRMPLHVAPPFLAGLVAGLVLALWGTATIQLWWITLSGLDAIAFALLFKGYPRAKRPLAPSAWDSEEEDQGHGDPERLWSLSGESD